jgi:hypothetical protein
MDGLGVYPEKEIINASNFVSGDKVSIELFITRFECK